MVQFCRFGPKRVAYGLVWSAGWRQRRSSFGAEWRQLPPRPPTRFVAYLHAVLVGLHRSQGRRQQFPAVRHEDAARIAAVATADAAARPQSHQGPTASLGRRRAQEGSGRQADVGGSLVQALSRSGEEIPSRRRWVSVKGVSPGPSAN